MKERIKWPAGNRLDLCIPLRKITVTEEGTQFGEYVPSQAAVVMVYFVGNYASYEYTPRIEDNKLYITDNGELKPGVYAIDVRIQEPERKLRSFRCGELEIVRETKQLALGDFVLNNNVTLDADAFIFGEGPSAFEVAVRDGYTGTKAEWLESLRGKEGRGIADIVSLPTGAFRILLTDGSAYVTPILKGEQGVSIVDFTVSSITSQEVLCTITMSDGTTRTVNLPRGEKGEQGDAGEDGRGIQSVVMNNDYTITFSYTDGTSYTTPQALRGEKGENGQDGQNGQDGRGISSMALDDDNHLSVSYTDGTTYTTPQSLQGERGVSITDFEQVGESATMTFFNIYYSNGNISQIGLPKGEQGDRGEQGPQGIKGDTVVLGEVGEYKLYNVAGSATDGAMTQDATTKAIAAANGYYECGTAAGTAAKVAVGDNEALYTLQKSGSIKVKMTNANAAASGVTLKIGSSAATPLYYNDEPVSASNTWEAGEVISVYFDGTNYQATNAQGGGGKAEKIKYDNSASGLAADNVQGVVDDVLNGDFEIDLSLLTQQNGFPHTHSRKWVVDKTVRKHYVIPRLKGCSRLTVTANNTKDSTIQFFSLYSTPINGEDVPLCNSPLSTLIVPMGTTATLPIPDDCQYIVVLARITTTNYIPVSVKQSVFIDSDTSNDVYDIDYSYMYAALGWVGASGEQVTTTGSLHYTIPLSGGIKYIEMTANNTINYTWATSLGASGWARLVEQRFQVTAGERKVIEVPEGALYIIIGKTTSSTGNDYTPATTKMYTSEGYEQELSLTLAPDVDIPVDFSKHESLLGFIQADGTWLRNDDGSAHYKIPVTGDSVTIESGESDGTYDSSFAFASDAEGFYWTLLTGQTRIVQQVSNAVTYNIPEGARYLIVNKASSSSSTLDLTPRSVVFHKSPREIIEENAIEQSGSPYTANKWRVMIYNIGHLNGGGASSQSNITDSNYDSKKFVLSQLFTAFDTNIVGFAEYPLLFAPNSSHPTETTQEAILNKYWQSLVAPRRTDVTDVGYNALMARVPFEQLESVHYQGEGLIRYYIRGYWNLLGIKVKFITSHLQYNTADKTDLTYQYAQIQEMLDDCANDSHAIIMGDLNTPAEDVVSYLTTGGYVDSGWKICNGSVYGTYNTYRKDDGIRGSKTLDNIIVKGFEIEKVYMLVSTNSDHNALLTDIRAIV